LEAKSLQYIQGNAAVLKSEGQRHAEMREVSWCRETGFVAPSRCN